MALIPQKNTRKPTITSLLLAVGFLSGVSADFLGRTGGFKELGSDRLLNTEVMQQELEAAMMEALGLGSGVREAHLEAKTAKILPMFQAMPKNMQGRVGRDAMQYMVTRYFGHEHGWSIKGFDTPAGNNSAVASSVEILQQKLPLYVEAVLEQRLEQHGFGLGDVVTVVAVLEKMIFSENLEMLEDAYYLQSKETIQALNRSELTDVVLTYMLIYGFQAERRNRTDLTATVGKIVRGYKKGWPTGLFGLAELNAELDVVKRENPFAFVERDSRSGVGYSFEVAARAVARASENYGKWTNTAQCQELKQSLAGLDREGTGRVRLVDFYKKDNVSNNWFLEETRDYLRHVGALDESSAIRGPQVIIPNYVQAPSNCLEVSAFYSICCLKECEGLLGMIEREILSPFASPARLVEVVQGMIKSREDSSRNLTTQMVTQLDVVAEQHGGKVPLHGRLFSQWLHYAFPHECPYPQTTHEATNYLLTTEYTKRTGKPSVLTVGEIKQYIAGNDRGKDAPAANPEDAEDWADTMSQWTMEEELYVGHHHQGPRAGMRGSSAWSVFATLAKFGIVAGGFLGLKPPLLKAYHEFSGDGEKKSTGSVGTPSFGEAPGTVLV